MGSPQASKLIRRHAHVLEEQPTQMPSGDEQARAQIFLGLAVEGPVHDELYSPTDQIRTAPADRKLGAVGAAARACPKAGCLRHRRQRVWPDILRRLKTRCTSGQAVEPGGDDGG